MTQGMLPLVFSRIQGSFGLWCQSEAEVICLGPSPLSVCMDTVPYWCSRGPCVRQNVSDFLLVSSTTCILKSVLIQPSSKCVEMLVQWIYFVRFQVHAASVKTVFWDIARVIIHRSDDGGSKHL
jgi:hypothetical protein